MTSSNHKPVSQSEQQTIPLSADSLELLVRWAQERYPEKRATVSDPKDVENMHRLMFDAGRASVVRDLEIILKKLKGK